MKKMISAIAMLFILLAFFSSCIESVNNKLIVGKWNAVSWTENGMPNVAKSENTSFVFDEKEHYSFTHDGTTKSGTYKVENNLLNADYGSNHSQEGKLSFIWTDEKVEAKSLPDSTVIMELVFSHQGDLLEEDLKLSSDLTAIEAWDADFNKHNIVLTAGKIAPASIDNVINTERWEVSPNPTSGKVNFNASLKTAKSVQIELTNGEGKALLKQKLNLAKGNSSTPLNLNGQGRLAAGIYYFKVSGIEASPVKQIVVY
jgi:hypothetical protein